MKLPPLKEALSADALAKLDSMAPPLSRAIRVAWDEAKPRTVDLDDTVKRLEGRSVRSADGETVPTGTRPLRRKHRPVP